MKPCGKNHGDHDWGDDGRCRRCGARWQCPPHWWRIDNFGVGRCRFCPAIHDFGEISRRRKAKRTQLNRKLGKETAEIKKRRKRERQGKPPG